MGFRAEQQLCATGLKKKKSSQLGVKLDSRAENLEGQMESSSDEF